LAWSWHHPFNFPPWADVDVPHRRSPLATPSWLKPWRKTRRRRVRNADLPRRAGLPDGVFKSSRDKEVPFGSLLTIRMIRAVSFVARPRSPGYSTMTGTRGQAVPALCGAKTTWSCALRRPRLARRRRRLGRVLLRGERLHGDFLCWSRSTRIGDDDRQMAILLPSSGRPGDQPEVGDGAAGPGPHLTRFAFLPRRGVADWRDAWHRCPNTTHRGFPKKRPRPTASGSDPSVLVPRHPAISSHSDEIFVQVLSVGRAGSYGERPSGHQRNHYCNATGASPNDGGCGPPPGSPTRSRSGMSAFTCRSLSRWRSNTSAGWKSRCSRHPCARKRGPSLYTWASGHVPWLDPIHGGVNRAFRVNS